MKVFQSKAVFLGISISLVLTSGCSKTTSHQHFGEAIDPNALKVTLAELVAKPQTWDGKTIVVDGQFAGKCGDGDMYFKDKFDIIEADPPSPQVCLLDKGTPVRLLGLVKARPSHGTESEKAEKHAEAEEKSEKTAGRQFEVRIVAKGVEVLK